MGKFFYWKLSKILTRSQVLFYGHPSGTRVRKVSNFHNGAFGLNLDLFYFILFYYYVVYFILFFQVAYSPCDEISSYRAIRTPYFEAGATGHRSVYFGYNFFTTSTRCIRGFAEISAAGPNFRCKLKYSS